MVMFVGGMFEIFKKTGALDAGLDTLVTLSGGRITILAPVLILAIDLGSTFLGLMSEYIVLLPILLDLGKRLKLSPILCLAILSFGAKLGYVASVSNPIVLPVAQSIAGVPLFSGTLIRFYIFITLILISIGYFLFKLSQSNHDSLAQTPIPTPLLTRHRIVLGLMGIATLVLIWAAPKYKWHSNELSAFYIFLAMLIATAGRLKAREAADAFIQGMKGMMLAGLLIGLATTIELLLKQSLVLDTVIDKLANLVTGQPPVIVAIGIMMIETVLDLLIPSTSGKAAISIPILAPIAHLAGLSPQTCVLAFLLGNGIMGLINPSSGLNLAFLAIAKISYSQWLRFALPLVMVLWLAAGGILVLAAQFGY